MGETIYPTADNLSNFLAGVGLSSSILAGFNLEQAVWAGIAAFETAVGRKMLADKDEIVRYYDPPDNGTLMFDADLTALGSVVYQPQGASSETLVQNEDYRLGPYNAAADGRPYRWMEMQRRWWRPVSIAYQGALQIHGRFGYGDEIPEDAWMAMLQGSGIWIFAGGHFRLTGGVESYKEGDTSRQFGPIKNYLDVWRMSYDQTVSRYVRAGL